MKRSTLLIIFSVIITTLHAQEKLTTLTVEKIMRDPKWIGYSPSSPYWSADGNYLLFSWNPAKADDDSTYYITKDNKTPQKASYDFTQKLIAAGGLRFNTAKTAYLYAKNGDVFLVEVKGGKTRQITQTLEQEVNPVFISNDSKVVYSRSQNLFSWDIASGLTTQLTNFQRSGAAPAVVPAGQGQGRGGFGGQRGGGNDAAAGNAQERALKAEQLQLFEVLKDRKEKRDKSEAYTKSLPKTKELRTINIEDKILTNVVISPDGRFVTYRLFKAAAGDKNTIVPDYVTESGFTTDIPGRTKVGSAQGTYEFFVFDKEKDTVLVVKTDQIPGINDAPDYAKDYPSKDTTRRKPVARGVIINGPSWSDKGRYAVVDIRSQDNKDRWLMLLDASTAKLSPIDRQRDEAWVGGPGIGFGFGNTNTWIDDNTFWFQSEATGYSHLYKMNLATNEKSALTSGNYEVQRTQLSNDRKFFYITTNEVHPGEQHLYKLPVTGGKAEKLTTMPGANQVTISPDEKQIAILYSSSNKPWELYLQENKAGSKPQQITNLAMSSEFSSYAWREPEVITFNASDGKPVYARLFKPSKPHASKPAVVFVHGAGYLQNAHKWWSSYFREYMFHNLLVDNGYTVLDIDYRGSAGYGRDWRTGIYRFMGGKDLSDHVDGAKFLVEKHGVNPKHIGIYGGSYGGFITLMAMFTQPGVFEAGAALRSVTDWAHYNHGYTSNILNEPFTDSIAYRKSSPIYYAEGLKGHLLMCHGMVDVNVHFQDIVRLSQRLIELGKDNWELAVYPKEDHGFVEPSSWTDEYKRIYKLFETWLKKE